MHALCVHTHLDWPFRCQAMGAECIMRCRRVQNTNHSACQGGTERYASVPLLHYTYASAVNEKGLLVKYEDGAWTWNKRNHTKYYPPLPLELPPHGTPEAVVAIIMSINEAGMSPDVWPWWKAHMEPI